MVIQKTYSLYVLCIVLLLYNFLKIKTDIISFFKKNKNPINFKPLSIQYDVDLAKTFRMNYDKLVSLKIKYVMKQY